MWPLWLCNSRNFCCWGRGVEENHLKSSQLKRFSHRIITCIGSGGLENTFLCWCNYVIGKTTFKYCINRRVKVRFWKLLALQNVNVDLPEGFAIDENGLFTISTIYVPWKFYRWGENAFTFGVSTINLSSRLAAKSWCHNFKTPLFMKICLE